MDIERLGLLLYKTDKSFKEKLNTELRKLRLTREELAIIMDLYQQKTIGSEQSRTVTIIASRLDIEFDDMEEYIEKLERSDWIVRIHDQVDRRREDIFLSSKAMSIIDYLRQMYRYVEDKAYAGFSQEEIDQVESYLKRINQNLR